MKPTRSARPRVALQLLLALLCGGCFAHPSRAVVISGGDGVGNTSAPADDPGWANVGTIGGLTGVYLGNGWVLTANHVGPNAIVLQGVTYQPVPGSRVRFETSPGAFADLIVYRIQGAPPLPDIVLSDTTPAVNDVVTMVGDGWNRSPSQVFWDDQWQEVTPPPPPEHTGYKNIGGRVLRWGRNEVSASGLTVVVAGPTTHAFYTTFDLVAGVEHESQAVPGDSGGAVFIKRADQWQLAGILFAQGTLPGQPGATAVFGQQSYAADVAFYRDDILAAIAPAVVPALAAPALMALSTLLTVAGCRALRVGLGSR